MSASGDLPSGLTGHGPEVLLLDDLPMAAALVIGEGVTGNRAWRELDSAGSASVPDDVVVAVANGRRTGNGEPCTRLEVEAGRIVRLRATNTSGGAVLVTREVVNREYDLRSDATAATDRLTGLANRDAAEAALASAMDQDLQTCVLFIDLDRFTVVNDTLGHAAGDEVLGVVAERLTHRTRSTDVVARWGGDEFVVVLVDVDEIVALQISRRLATDLELPVHLEDATMPLGASIGFAMTSVGEKPSAVLDRADAAMYRAKTRRMSDPSAAGLEVSQRAKLGR
jgi:diguanylate cyclase (GGDEF)-like protein